MGKRGPTKKPTNLKILQGNPGKRKLNENEPQFEISEEDLLKPPPFLGTYAKKEWKRIIPLLLKNKLVTNADIMALAAYCQSYDRWILAEKEIRKYKFTSETDKGNIVQRPEVGIANKAMENMVKFAKEFGLTPSSRVDLHAGSTEESKNPFMELMGSGKKNG